MKERILTAMALLIGLGGCGGLLAACGEKDDFPPPQNPRDRAAVEESSRAVFTTPINWCGTCNGADRFSDPGPSTVFFFSEWSPDAQFGFCCARHIDDDGDEGVNVYSAANNQWSSVTIGRDVRLQVYDYYDGWTVMQVFECNIYNEYCPLHYNLAAGSLASLNDRISAFKLCSAGYGGTPCP